MQKITLIGMGASAATLTAEGWDALRRAERVAGARRLLEALPPEIAAERIPAVKPEEILSALEDASSAAVLYSGDTGFYSGAPALLERLRGRQVQVEIGRAHV